MLRGIVSKRTDIFHEPDRGFLLQEIESIVWLPNDEQITIVRPGFHTGDGVTILPYFRHPQTEEWMVVLVSQFRPNVSDVCLEAPGTIREPGLSPQEQMVKVAKEEAGVTIAENLVKILAIGYLANSFNDQKVWIGAVKIDVPDVEEFQKGLCGRTDPNSNLEFTEPAVYTLKHVLKHRHLLINYNLTREQILELAIHLGLLRLTFDE